MKNISINTNEGLLQSFDDLCRKLGFNRTAAINVFMTQAVREQRIPFEVTAAREDMHEISEDRLRKALQEGLDDWRQGRTLSREEAHAFINERKDAQHA